MTPGDDFRSPVPSWDGNPDRWVEYRDEVSLWLMAEDLEKTYSVAVRLVQRMTGSAKKMR